jgi:hypothetical protein
MTPEAQLLQATLWALGRIERACEPAAKTTPGQGGNPDPGESGEPETRNEESLP